MDKYINNQHCQWGVAFWKSQPVPSLDKRDLKGKEAGYPPFINKQLKVTYSAVQETQFSCRSCVFCSVNASSDLMFQFCKA